MNCSGRHGVYNFLANDKGNEYSVKQISEGTGIGKASVARIVKKMCYPKANFVIRVPRKIIQGQKRLVNFYKVE